MTFLKQKLMKFRYCDDLEKLKVPCPPISYQPENRIAYRWIFENMHDERNFTPRFYLAPPADIRKIEAIENPTKRDKRKCSYLALSMFDSEKNALDSFNFHKENLGENVYLFLGTNIAVGELTVKDGVQELPNQEGHFNHHPTENHNYENRFIKIAKL